MLKKGFWTDLWFLLLWMAGGLLLLLPLLMIMMSAGQHVTMWMMLTQWGQTLLMEVLPVMCWYRWYKKEPIWPSLRMNSWPGWQSMVGAIILALVALPLSDVLGSLNLWLCNHLPEGLRQSIEASRLQNEMVMNQLLDVHGVWGWLSLILLMCLATGLAEEMVFRGALLRTLGIKADDDRTWHQYGRGSVLRVALLTGLIFSVIHLDADGLLPRWALGALFVYIVYWTGSLWPAIAAHATNNLMALITTKYASEWTEALAGSWYALLSVVLIILCGKWLSGLHGPQHRCQ